MPAGSGGVWSGACPAGTYTVSVQLPAGRCHWQCSAAGHGPGWLAMWAEGSISGSVRLAARHRENTRAARVHTWHTSKQPAAPGP